MKSGTFSTIETALLRVYRAWSATRPPRCRYVPTCSEYAVEAFQVHSFWQAHVLVIRRLSRCHPWGSWGYDPVPNPSAISQGNPAQ